MTVADDVHARFRRAALRAVVADGYCLGIGFWPDESVRGPDGAWMARKQRLNPLCRDGDPLAAGTIFRSRAAEWLDARDLSPAVARREGFGFRLLRDLP